MLASRGRIAARILRLFSAIGKGTSLASVSGVMHERLAELLGVHGASYELVTHPEAFTAMTEAEFQARFSDTPFERPGLTRMRRNWRVASRGGRS